MVGVRKVCINVNAIAYAHQFNAQVNHAGEDWNRMEVPQAVYKTADFSFAPSAVCDYFIDPESKENDIIIWIAHRGEIRFQYDPLLLSELDMIFRLK